MKVAVVGARGQLGQDLAPLLEAEYGEVVGLTRAEIDLARPEMVAPALAGLEGGLVINCAAYNLVDKAEDDRAAAFATNAGGVVDLASACARVGAKLVHVGTDYVCGGPRSTPWAETDRPNPESIYAKSKLAGEWAALADPRNLVVRTCGLFGVHGSGGKGTNFLETMLRVAGQGKPLRVVDDQVCSPTYTKHLARGILELIRRDATGLFHVVNPGAITWHGLAAELFRQVGVAADLTPITTAEFGARARRPAYSVLSTAKYDALVGTPLPGTAAAVAEYLAERAAKLAAAK